MSDAPKSRTIERAEPERLNHLARGVVRGDYLVVDLHAAPEWSTSLMLITDGIVAARNLGVVLVPVAPHLAGRWINGRVPAVTIECCLVAQEDMAGLQRRIKKMNEALFPDENQGD